MYSGDVLPCTAQFDGILWLERCLTPCLTCTIMRMSQVCLVIAQGGGRVRCERLTAGVHAT